MINFNRSENAHECLKRMRELDSRLIVLTRAEIDDLAYLAIKCGYYEVAASALVEMKTRFPATYHSQRFNETVRAHSKSKEK